MIIAIDASRSVKTIQKTGVEKVSDELLTEIEKLRNNLPALLRKALQAGEIKGKEVNFIFYTPQEINWLPKENQRILRWPFKFFWTQIRLAWELIFHPPQVMFFPVHSIPLVLSLVPNRLSLFKVIHDVAFKKHPEFYSWKQRLILNLDLWLSLKVCHKIFVPTEAVKNDILKECHPEHGPDSIGTKSRDHIDSLTKKIIVTPWGYHPFCHSKRSEESLTPVKKKQILYIGRIEEKKNINNLIKGFEIFHATHPDYKLILAGKVDTKSPISNFQIPNKSQNSNSKPHNTSYIIHNTIEFLGFVSEEKKHELLRESSALVLVSKEEGFGFPILEAFDFGLPVIASDIPVLQEVGGNACLYVNPNSPEEIAEKMCFVGTGLDLSTKIQNGYLRLQNFSWQKTTEKILTELTKQKTSWLNQKVKN